MGERLSKNPRLDRRALFKCLASALLVLSMGCVHTNSAPSVTLEVVTTGLKSNALIYHVNGDAYGYDLIAVKITRGPYLNETLEIALPQPGGVPYNQLVAEVPARKKMWELLRLPSTRLVIVMGRSELDRYRKIAGDPSRLLPSVDGISITSVELVPK